MEDRASLIFETLGCDSLPAMLEKYCWSVSRVISRTHSRENLGSKYFESTPR
jgi:hypothetical protein